MSFLREWLHPTRFPWRLHSFRPQRRNWSSFLQHLARDTNLSSLLIWRDRLPSCGQADGLLLPPGSAPLHPPPQHQHLHSPCQLMSGVGLLTLTTRCHWCWQLLVSQHPVQARLLHLLLLSLASPKGTGDGGPLRRRVE